MTSIGPTVPLAGKRAIVTGGSRGIGAGIVDALHRAGARIVMNYRSAAHEAMRRVEALNSRRPESAIAVRADVADEAAVTEMFRRVDEWCGGVDILVNNAGFERCDHLLDTSLADWRRVLDTNVTGAFLCTREAGRRMEAQFIANRDSTGVVINLSSIHDRVPRKGFAHYCTAKAGLTMLTKATALELAEFGVRAVTVSPGAIATDMNRDEIAAFGEERFQEWIPAGRVGNVDDVSYLVAFLCGRHAAYMTGTELYVDGGYSQRLVQYDPRAPRDPGRGLGTPTAPKEGER